MKKTKAKEMTMIDWSLMCNGMSTRERVRGMEIHREMMNNDVNTEYGMSIGEKSK